MSLLEHVRAACDAARQHADVSSSLFNYILGGANVEAVRQEHRLLSQELRRKIAKAKGGLRSEEDPDAELLDALKNMRADVEAVPPWAQEERSRLDGLMADMMVDPAVSREAWYRAQQECERLRQRVLESARRAEELAKRIPEGRGDEEGKNAPPPLSGAGDKPPAKKPPALVPSWHKVRRLLRLGDEDVCAFSRKRSAQFAVLDALEAAGWPDTGVKLPKGVRVSLKDAVEALNETVSASRLRFAFSDNEVTWYLR
jgi:hypothetical protein